MLLQAFVQRVHFVGIGGAGMSAIAELLHRQGLQVSGSDAGDSAALRRLSTLGLRVHVGHDAVYLGHAQVLVTSAPSTSATRKCRLHAPAACPCCHVRRCWPN